MTAKIHAAIMAIRVAIDARIESLVIHTESEALYLKTILPVELLVSKNKWLELGEAINRFDGKISWKYVLRRRGNFGSMQAYRMARYAAGIPDGIDEYDSDSDDEDDLDGDSDDGDDSDNEGY